MTRAQPTVFIQGLHLTFLVILSLVCCLPRAPESAGGFGHATRGLSWQSATMARTPQKADALLLHVRKFRRRKMAFSFYVHLAACYLPSPLRKITARFARTANFLIDRRPAPLIHPPA